MLNRRIRRVLRHLNQVEQIVRLIDFVIKQRRLRLDVADFTAVHFF